MNVDADSLERLNLRTRDGAERAGIALAEHLGTKPRIGTTRITLVSQADLAGEIGRIDGDCVEFDLDGRLSGRVLLAFDAGMCGRLEAADADDVTSAAVDLVGAFVAEWSDHTGGSLTVGDPRYVEEPESHDFGLEAVTPDTESTPVFRSGLRIDDGTATLYFAPDGDSLRTLLTPDAADDKETGATDGEDGGLFEDEGTTPLPLEKLSVFGDLTREGTRVAAERVTEMTDIETTTEISGVTFTPIDDISSQLSSGEYVGTTAEFEGTPSGAVVILYRESTAEDVAEAMLPAESTAEGMTEMHESALAELGNVMISGFIDGWANVLQNSVDHTPPEYETDMEIRMVELVTDQLGPFQTHAYTVESRIETDDVSFDCEIHALPDEAKLSEALESLVVERRGEFEADPDEIF
jgi:chemotaxis protein CheY-P-specific phosphatase CheC